MLTSELSTKVRDATELYIARELGQFVVRRNAHQRPNDKVDKVDNADKVDKVNRVDKKVDKVNKVQ